MYNNIYSRHHKLPFLIRHWYIQQAVTTVMRCMCCTCHRIHVHDWSAVAYVNTCTCIDAWQLPTVHPWYQLMWCKLEPRLQSSIHYVLVCTRTRSESSSTCSNKMAAQIEYDDSGSTTFYFILSIYLLVLLPVSYFLLPKKKKQKEDGGYKGALCIRGQYTRDTVVLVFVQYLNRNA